MAPKINVHARTITAAAAMATAVMIASNPIAATADTALIMGGTGVPTPPQSYVDAVENLYLAPNGYGAYTPQVLTMPTTSPNPATSGRQSSNFRWGTAYLTAP